MTGVQTCALPISWLAGEKGCDWQELGQPEVRYLDEDGEGPAAPSGGAGREAPARTGIRAEIGTGPEAETSGDATKVPPVPVPAPSLDGVTLASFSATSFALFEWCPLAWRRRYRQGLDLRWEIPDEAAGGTGDAESAGGADLGTLAHWILARWPSDRPMPGERDSLSWWLSDPRVPQRLPANLREIGRAHV